MTAPGQSPGRSRQDYQTPVRFIEAVVAEFGRIAADLAASPSNAIGDGAYYTEQVNALRQDWTALRGNLWCNPPFADLAPWAWKCAESVGPGRRILLLTPASVGSNWFAEHVHGRALVLALRPRLTFGGCSAPYPKDLILSVYSTELRDRPAFEPWRWDAKQVAA